MFPVQATNKASRLLVATGLETGASAVMAPFITIASAAGGALFGVTQAISQIPLRAFTSFAFNANHKDASTDAKIISRALEFFGPCAAAWGTLALAGFKITFFDAVLLSVTSQLAVVGIVLFVSIFFAKGDFAVRT